MGVIVKKGGFMVQFPIRYAISTVFRSGDREWFSQRINDTEKLPVNLSLQFRQSDAYATEGFCPEELFAASLVNHVALEFQAHAKKNNLQFSQLEIQCSVSIKSANLDATELQKVEMVVIVHNSSDRSRAEVLMKSLSQRLWMWNCIKGEKELRFQTVQA